VSARGARYLAAGRAGARRLSSFRPARSENGSSARSILEIAAVPNVVDLSLCAEARRALEQVLAERGLGFFVKPGGRSPRLDSRRIAWVVEVARRSRRGRHRDPDALSRTRRVVRRELIRRLAARMVEVGL
jgi:hypothetical protein